MSILFNLDYLDNPKLQSQLDTKSKLFDSKSSFSDICLKSKESLFILYFIYT